MDSIPWPRFKVKPVEPFTRQEVERLLHACKHSRLAKTKGRQPFKMLRPTHRRDTAILLLLLDTGLRASELCALRVRDIDMATGEIKVRHGRDGGAKGEQGRIVYAGKATRKVVWRNLMDEPDEDDDHRPLLRASAGRPLNRDSLRLLLKRLGRKAGVRNCHPHRFRHTFAVNFPRPDGALFMLQELPGNRSLEMVRWCVRLAQKDLRRAHRRSSPVDSWAL
jgi:integrase/recombinase XerD